MIDAPKESKPIRIFKLEIDAFKRISGMELTFDPAQGLIPITGKNGAGKSSVLDAISAALGGGELCPDKPIKTGHTKASVTVELGDLTVCRTFSLSGSSQLKITAKDGSNVKSPQALLDSMLANLSFDPHRFMRMAPKDQVEELKKVAGLNEPLASLELKIKEATDNRLIAGRTLRLAAGARASVPPIPDGPDTEVPLSKLLAALDEADSVMTETEEWRLIAGFEQYKVSNRGQVMSFSSGCWQLMKLKQDLYLKVHLYPGKKKYRVHRLVAEAFVPNPNSLSVVNHIDGDKHNNHASNLEWTTTAGNNAHARANGLTLVGTAGSNGGSKNPRAKLSESDVLEIKRCLLKGSKQQDLADRFSVTHQTIYLIAIGKNWSKLTA